MGVCGSLWPSAKTIGRLEEVNTSPKILCYVLIPLLFFQTKEKFQSFYKLLKRIHDSKKDYCSMLSRNRTILNLPNVRMALRPEGVCDNIGISCMLVLLILLLLLLLKGS